MKTFIHFSTLFTLLLAATLAGCSSGNKSPDVSSQIRKTLDESNLKSVDVTQDRDKGVVTLGGHVASDTDKANAESIAKSIATGQVVADQIAVLPPGSQKDAKAMDKDLDKGIAENLDAALIQNKLHNDVKYTVKNMVVTLSGDVDSPALSQQAQSVAAAVPNVQQVVNELQVKDQKATSSR